MEAHELEKLQADLDALKQWAEAVSKQLGCDPPSVPSVPSGPTTQDTGGGGGPHEPR